MTKQRRRRRARPAASPDDISDSESSSPSGASSSTSDTGSLSDSSSQSRGSTVHTSVAFRDPAADIQPQVSALLDAYGPHAEALAAAVCRQTRVGTVVLLDEAPLGVLSCLSYAAHAQVLPATPFEPTGTGWIVFGTPLLNFPAALFPWLLQALFDELQWAVEDDTRDAPANSPFAFTRYVHVGRAHVGRPDSERRRGVRQRKQAKRQQTPRTTPGYTFASILDDAFYQHAIATHVLRLERTAVAPRGQVWLAMFVEARSIPDIRRAVRLSVGDENIPAAETGQLLTEHANGGTA
ncbi:hypothetical protein CDCA_CDCA02G0614 [Cyanidium caldarium]|uniref:Uncharacterized protein n=1 Tax=Cyanidium caldarium TaxID=2771 RepID=A0AAV9IR16_CYACA|nr:hypothetical protein CDCA_CDCA02G0614 [Cyanidium caldarium]